MATKRTKEFLKNFDKEKTIFEEGLKKMQDLEAERVSTLELEQGRLDTLKAKISMLCHQEDMFCGVVLTQEDVLNVLEQMLESGEREISISFNLYHINE